MLKRVIIIVSAISILMTNVVCAAEDIENIIEESSEDNLFEVDEDEFDTIDESVIKVNIDSSLFSDTCIRLNTEIYDIAANWFSKYEAKKDLGGASSVLLDSYLEVMNPLVPLALSVNETGSWKDSRYTWTPAIYSKPMEQVGANMDNISVDAVSSETYLVLGLVDYMGCGNNCSASQSQHYHFNGKNDQDSLGPLQTLRRYIEKSGGVTYGCGERCVDLMSWKDNVVYLQHSLTESFIDAGDWASGISIKNTEQLVALAGVLHNTGATFIRRDSASATAASNWNSVGAIFKFTEDITSEESIKEIEDYVKEWFSSNVVSGTSFSLPGEGSTSSLDTLLSAMGINKADYASSFQHKQYYPLRAVLNYVALKMLYTSGG